MTAAPPAYAVPRPERFSTEPDVIEVGGTTLAVRREGSGPVVLYLHGHWLARRWLPFHARLAEQVDLVAPDLPGFGESAKPSWLTSREDVVLVLRDLVEHLDAGPVHVVGHGLGAWIAADLAIWAPAQVASLTVLAPFGLRVPGEPIADIFIVNPEQYGDTYFGAAGAEGFEDLVPGTGTPMLPGGVEEYAQRYGEMGAAAALMWQRRYDLKLETRLPRLRRPALVIDGAEDRVVPAAHAARWAELTGGRRVTVEDAGHAVHLQQPERTADAVASFVQEVSA